MHSAVMTGDGSVIVSGASRTYRYSQLGCCCRSSKGGERSRLEVGTVDALAEMICLLVEVQYLQPLAGMNREITGLGG